MSRTTEVAVVFVLALLAGLVWGYTAGEIQYSPLGTIEVTAGPEVAVTVNGRRCE